MPREGRPRIYADNAEKMRVYRRRAREATARIARAERAAVMAALTPKSAAEKVAFYRTEKAIAEQRWRERGGPLCGLTSGRHPIMRGPHV